MNKKSTNIFIVLRSSRFHALMLALTLFFIAPPIIKSVLDSYDVEFEFSELESEEDSEEEVKLADLDDEVLLHEANIRNCQNALLNSAYYQMIHAYSEYDRKVQVPPPEHTS